jgi:hypothetical protein
MWKGVIQTTRHLQREELPEGIYINQHSRSFSNALNFCHNYVQSQVKAACWHTISWSSHQCQPTFPSNSQGNLVSIISFLCWAGYEDFLVIQHF